MCVDRVMQSHAVAGVEWHGGCVWSEHCGAEGAADVGPDHAPAGRGEQFGAEE